MGTTCEVCLSREGRVLKNDGMGPQRSIIVCGHCLKRELQLYVRKVLEENPNSKDEMTYQNSWIVDDIFYFPENDWSLCQIMIDRLISQKNRK